MENIIIDKIAFELKEDYKGFTLKATYLTSPKGDALIEIFKEGILYREFLFPAYKIYNIAAHFNDIVEGELINSTAGYEAAEWNGLTGAIVIF